MDEHKIDYGGRRRSSIPSNHSNTSTGSGHRSILRINVSGRKFELLRSSLVGFPQTRLGIVALLPGPVHDLEEVDDPLYDNYDMIKQEYYFQRNPSCFHLVISYYVNNTLHVPRHLCTQLFQEEMEYWCIPFSLTNCCQGYHRQEWETSEGVRLTNQLFEQRTKKSICPGSSVYSAASTLAIQRVGKYKRLRMKIWDLFENSESSNAASWMSVLSSLMVIFSMIILCIGTLPGLSKKSNGSATRAAIGSSGNDTLGSNTSLYVLEILCITWFTFEYLIRTFTCPSYKDYFLSIMNSIDLLAILPFYITLIVENLTDIDINSKFTTIRKSLQVLRIFRVIRIFKIARHSAGLQVLGYTVKNSLPELGLLLMLLIMGMTLFSSLAYYAEQGVNPQFDSIIAAFWWSIISMTTVGYGDMAPQTTFGKIIGSVCCVSGILFIALPIPTIVSNFSSFYKDHRNKEKLNKINSKECAGITTSDLDLDLELQLGNRKPKSPEEVVLGYRESIEKSRALSLTLIERQGSYLRRMSVISDASFKLPTLPVLTEDE